MKKILLTLLILQSFTNTYSQVNHDWCGTNQFLEHQWKSQPSLESDFWNEENAFSQFVRNHTDNKKMTTLIVPVVVHVMHFNGNGNISEAQVIDGIRVINEDFKRINADTGNTRALFKPFAAGMDIEFRLAKKDPNGNCTNGIVRVNSGFTNQAGENVKALSQWPEDKYFNVWLVNQIENFTGGTGTILGYAQFPPVTGGLDDTYGVVNRHDRWGSIGTAVDDGRTATHEVGHCLRLFHTFQNSSQNDLCENTNCSNMGDRVCDTPPASSATQNCDFNIGTCTTDAASPQSPFTTNVVDQIENYMSYNACQNMFSQGQVSRMQSILVSNSALANLVSPSNNILTGTDDPYFFSAPVCIPVAEFSSDKKLNCEGGEIKYYDYSYNSIQDSTWQWNWTFPGGTPSNSNLQNPIVTYSQAGNYDVSLSISNAQGTSPILTKSNYVNISASSGNFIAPATESFGLASFPTNVDLSLSWSIEKPQFSPSQWTRNPNFFLSGPGSIYLNNFNALPNEFHSLISPVVDLTQVNTAYLSFWIAYARRNQEVELLSIFYSTDCGARWISLATELSINLYSVPNQPNVQFVPQSINHWMPYNLDISSLAGSDNIKFKIQFKTAGGNNIFIDDFQIRRNPLTSINEIGNNPEIKIFPNPSNGDFVINLGKEFKLGSRISIYNSIGKIVYSGTLSENNQLIKTNDLNSGVYILKIQNTEYTFNQNIIIEN